MKKLTRSCSRCALAGCATVNKIDTGQQNFGERLR